MGVFKFYINETEFRPLNIGDLSVSIELSNEGGSYQYVYSLNGDLIVDYTIYNYIISHSDTQSVEFSIYEHCKEGVFKLFDHSFKFTNWDCTINEQKKQITIKLKQDSYYQRILDAYDINFNFLQVPNIVQAFYANDGARWEFMPYTHEVPAFYSCGTGSSYAPFGLAVRELRTTYCKGGNPQPPTGARWEKYIDACSTKGLCTWYRCPDFWYPFASLPTPPPGKFYFALTWDNVPNPPIFPSDPPFNIDPVTSWVLVGTLTNGVLNFGFWMDSYILDGTSITLENGRLLTDVIDFALNIIDDDLGLQSQFLFNTTNPVTGIYPSDVEGIQMHAISDIKDPTATEKATVEKTNLKEILEGYISGKLNCYWRVEERTRRLIIEHYSDLFSSGVVDLTSYQDSLKYNYDKTNIPKSEEFPSLDKAIDFTGVDILYNNGVCSNKKTYNTDRFYSDVESIINDSDDYSNDGIVIITPESLSPLLTTTPSGVRAENGAITGDYYPNAPQGMANLHDKYWRDYRPFENGNLNFEDVEFTRNPVKEFEPINMKLCCFYLFDPYSKFVGKNFTEGRLKKAEFKFTTNMITLNIVE